MITRKRHFVSKYKWNTIVGDYCAINLLLLFISEIKLGLNNPIRTVWITSLDWDAMISTIYWDRYGYNYEKPKKNI